MTLRTIDAGGGGDHTTIAAAEAVAVYGDELRIIDESTYDEEVTWSGATGTASDGILINALTEHLGVFTAGPVHKTTGTGHVNTVSEDYLHFRGYTVLMDQTGSSDEGFRIDSGIDNILVERMIIRATTASADQDGLYAGAYAVGASPGRIVAVNCIFKNWGRAGIHAQNFGGSGTQYWEAHFCVFDKCGADGESESGGINSRADSGETSDIIIYNNVAARTASTFDDYSETGAGTLTWAGSHNACSDTSLTNIGVTTGKIENSDITTELTSPDTDDYSLATSSAYEGAGTDRTGSSPDSRADLTIDIAKNTRPATPSIGAFDTAAAGATERTATDELLLLDQRISASELRQVDLPFVPDQRGAERAHLQVESVLTPDQTVAARYLTLLATDTPLLRDELQRDIERLVADHPFLVDAVRKELERILADRPLADDTSRRELEKIIEDFPFIDDDQTITEAAVGVERTATDGLVFDEQTWRIVERNLLDALVFDEEQEAERVAQKPAIDDLVFEETAERLLEKSVVETVLLPDDDYRRYEWLIAQDQIPLGEEQSAEKAAGVEHERAVSDGLLLPDLQRAEVGRVLADAIVFDEQQTVTQEHRLDDALLLDDQATAQFISSQVDTDGLVFADQQTAEHERALTDDLLLDDQKDIVSTAAVLRSASDHLLLADVVVLTIEHAQTDALVFDEVSDAQRSALADATDHLLLPDQLEKIIELARDDGVLFDDRVVAVIDLTDEVLLRDERAAEQVRQLLARLALDDDRRSDRSNVVSDDALLYDAGLAQYFPAEAETLTGVRMGVHGLLGSRMGRSDVLGAEQGRQSFLGSRIGIES